MLKFSFNYRYLCSSGGSRPGVWGGSQIGGLQKGIHLLEYQRLSAKIVGYHTSGYFCWSNYAILRRITTVWKRFVSFIQKTFETGPKEWVSFFTSCTYLVYLKMYLKDINACCAQVFATVLDIYSEISEEQCLKRIPDVVRSRTVIPIRLGNDNWCPTIGLK